MTTFISRRHLLAVLAVAVCVSSPAAAGANVTDGVRMRRFALMAGFNDGGPTRPTLRFAASDAQAMAKVLETLGGVAPEDLLLVQGVNRAALLSAFDRLRNMLVAGRTEGMRREVVVYYSGHSDEEGLLVGGERVSYDELRARIQALPADVRLAILDSCASGAFTMHKGGVRRPPFVMDASVNTKGHAFLTSSAINEVAQESNRIGASFFTHYLVSGLRGAADVNHDRRVTLQEAFEFASQETLARTEKTRGGPQHAAYEFDLVGTSDIVVTDVRSTQATLALGTDLSGRIGVRDAAGNLVVELRKTSGSTIELGVEAGTYLVVMEGGANTFEAEVSLSLGQRADLARLAFHPGRPLEVATARGDVPAAANDKAVSGVDQTAQPPLRSHWIHLGLVPMGGDDQWDIHGLSFGFVADRIGKLSSGLQLSIGANFIDRELDGAQVTVGGNVVRGPVHGLQLSVGVNYATGPLHGAQIVTGFNMVAGDARGIQIATGLNLAGGRLSGAQIAAGANLATNDVHGAQVAAGVNLAGTVEGAQVAPINLAGRTNGSQVGVVNLVRRGRGFNVGVVNLAAEHEGETLGLLNLVGNGIHSVAAYATDSMLSNLDVKLGSRHLYTSVIFAYQPGDDLSAGPERFKYGSRRHGFGLGVGWRQPLDLGRLRYFEVQLSQIAVRSTFGSNGWSTDDHAPLLASARVLLGFHIAGPVDAIAGISGNTAVAWGGRDLDIGSGFLEGTQHSGQTTVREYPGLVLGLQM